MQCVQASHHQGDIQFKNAGKQCTANSLCAMVLSFKKPPNVWQSIDLDTILQDGECLYETIGSSRFLLISELPDLYNRYKIKPTQSYSGTMDRKTTEKPFYSIVDAVQDIDKFCFVTIECYTVAVFQHNGLFYIFDPHSRNECGMSSPEGKAVLSRHSNISNVCLFLRHLCASLFETNSKHVHFEVNHVSIKAISSNLHVDFDFCSSSSEFSGFSEISDGEYSCRLLMALEKEKEFEKELQNQSQSSCSSVSDYCTDHEYKLKECHLVGEKQKVEAGNTLLRGTESGHTDHSFNNDVEMLGDTLLGGKETGVLLDEGVKMFRESDDVVKDVLNMITDRVCCLINDPGNGESDAAEVNQVGNDLEHTNYTGDENHTEVHTESVTLENDGAVFPDYESNKENDTHEQGDNQVENDFFFSNLSENEEAIIDNTLSVLNDSSAFLQSINLETFEESDQSDTTVDYDIPESFKQAGNEVSTDDEIPLSFISKKSKIWKRKTILRQRSDAHTTENINFHFPEEFETQNAKSYPESGRGRKRLRNEGEWKRNIAKRRRNEGRSYTNRYGKEVRQRELKQPCGPKCRFKCSFHFNRTEREKLFHNFWKTGNVTKQRQFIAKYSARKPKLRNKFNIERKFSLKYTLPSSSGSLRVCKTFFLNTLGISQRVVYTAHQKSIPGLPGIVSEDKRGTSETSRWNITSTANLDFVRNHICSFPTIESHYCRKDSKRQYLQPGLSVAKMYSLYCQLCDTKNVTKVSLKVYRRIFNTEFNLGFHQPRNDQCEFCNSFKYASSKEKLKMLDDYKKHIRNKNLARQIKDSDKTLAKNDNNVVVACFDLEEVLVTPKGFESSLYYKRRLNSFNFTIYNLGNSEVHSYLWNETVASRGASEIASAVYSYIKQKSENGYKKFIFYSDNCAAQNKNRYYMSMIWYCIQKFDLHSVEHKYLEKGHTFNENDSVHAAIETASRHLSVYSTSQWAAVIRTCRPKKPYIVHEMSLDDFYDFKQLSECLKKFDLDDDRCKVYISEIKSFIISSDDPNRYLFKCDHGSLEHHSVNLISRLRRSLDSPPNPKHIDLLQLRKDAIPISTEKYNDLVSLCLSGVVPKPNHIFYALLPHNSSQD